MIWANFLASDGLLMLVAVVIASGIVAVRIAISERGED